MKSYISVFCLAIFAFFTASAQQAEQPYKVYMVSDAHFDTQWNWDVQTSIDQYLLNTIDQNLFLLNKFPHYIFNFEGGVKYAWMKEYYPEKYELVKKFIQEGRWHVAGSSWDANDTNIPSPESFIRNVLLGQQFYKDEFNVQSTDIFLPDCFGFSWTIPTIASHCGLIGFSTQKLQWRNNPFYGNNKIPFEIGLWEGVDGSRIMMAADGHNYASRWNDLDLSKNPEMLKIVENNPLNSLKIAYHYYGTGDTGGSPTVESVRTLEKSLKGKGPIQIISATSDQMYKDFLPFENHPELPVFKDELLMDVHGTGCYTSQAALKLYNRKNELAGSAAESAAVMADWLGGLQYPGDELNEAWKRFIWHQFHDDLPGTSIPRAYAFSWNDELLSLKQFTGILQYAAGTVSRSLDTEVKGIPVVIFNPLSCPVTEMVELNLKGSGSPQQMTVYNETGKMVPSQVLAVKDGNVSILVSAQLPSAGYVVYDVRSSGKTAQSSLHVTQSKISNKIYEITLNKNGDIASILDKRYNKELVKNGNAIRLALFAENDSYTWPAWEILKKNIDKAPLEINEDVTISIGERGPARASICVERKYKGSTFKQYIRLTDGGQDDRIDIYSEVDWQLKNAFLKAEFPLNVANPLATYDLGIGSIKRGNNTITAYEVCAQYWADLTDSDGSYGVSILNDCKYGWDKPDDNTLRLTLLNTPGVKGRYAYQGTQDHGQHAFTYSIVGHKGDYVHAQTVWKAEILNQSPKAFVTEKHPGASGKKFSFLQTNTEQVIVKSLKKAEKSDAYVIRLYEVDGKNAEQVEVSFANDILEAKELNGVEDVKGDVSFRGNKLIFNASPFAIKTFRVKLKPAETTVVPVKCAHIPLEFDLKTASYNGMRSTGNFDGKGGSYAAELLPELLISNGITFKLGAPEVRNGLRCAGDTILLPQDGTYNKLYLLAASSRDDNRGIFRIDNTSHELLIPYYSGFIGQWGYTGRTEGFLNPIDIAYTGTHKHTGRGNKDIAYEYTHMYKFCINIDKNTRQLILPRNKNIVLFALSLVQDHGNIVPATDLLGVHLKNKENVSNEPPRLNLLTGKKVIDKSGQTNQRERAELAFDGNPNTKWCDKSNVIPRFIDIDLEKVRTIEGWRVVHAGLEVAFYNTRAYSLQIKTNAGDPWITADTVTDNTEYETDRLLQKPIEARYIRLLLNIPDQTEGNFGRICEFEVY